MTREELIEAMTTDEETRKALRILDVEDFATMVWDEAYHRGFDDGVLNARYSRGHGDAG